MSIGRVLSLLLGICALSSACALEVVAGSGKVVTEPRTVSGFSRVSLSGSGQVFIDRTGAESVTVTTDDNLLPYIRTEVRDGTLELGFNDLMRPAHPRHRLPRGRQVARRVGRLRQRQGRRQGPR